MVALGGNALLRRGEPPEARLQQEHVIKAARDLARLAASHELMLKPSRALLQRELRAQGVQSVPWGQPKDPLIGGLLPFPARRSKGHPVKGVGPSARHGRWRAMRGIKTESVMTREVATATPDTPLKELARLLSEHRISGIPIVDEDRKLVGIVTEADLLSTPLKEIVWYMRSRDVSAVPVLDSDDRVAGVVSEADLLLKEEGLDREAPPFFERRRRRRERAKAAGKLAKELMTSPAVTVGASATVAEAARTMHRNGLKRLPVVDDRDRLVGIVSRADLIKVFLRPDEEIRAEAEDTLALSLRVHPSAMLVSVRDGVVRLEGRVRNRSEIAATVKQVRTIDGVVAVETELDFEVDDMAPENWVGPAHLMGP